ncbi:MAG TPA: hypothetical protein VGG20_14675, partial [Thermoanaerobaculia bacterium]
MRDFLQLLLRLAETPARYIFGRDIFISYSHVDAAQYAPDLAEALRVKRPKLSIYLDRWIAPTADKLPL